MLGPKPFADIEYKKPRLNFRKKSIGKLVGLDSEAYKDGTPFMFCTSTRMILTQDTLVDGLLKDAPTDFVTYNLKYDGGAILGCILTRKEMKILGRYHKVTTSAGLEISYLPHKHLSIKRDDDKIDIWDISQFYHTSLNKAALRYLHKRKSNLETKTFTKVYVKSNWNRLARYCIRDCILTAELANFLIAKLHEFGLNEVTDLYSQASLSFSYFHQDIKIVDVYDAWLHCPEALMYAHESYQGGKFECTRRGSFTGYEYDITSAYPYEMNNLINIAEAIYLQSKTPVEDAAYAYLRVHIKHKATDAPPCHGLLVDGVRVYACGSYYATITLAEYQYMTQNDIDVDIINGWWIVPVRRDHPYRSKIQHLFALKDSYKKKDPMCYSLTKIMMNGYYGKLANLNAGYVEALPGDHADKYGEKVEYKAGRGWNPFYSSVITANTRLAVCRTQQYLGRDCLATHTDSVLSLREIPPDMLSEKLGGLAFKDRGRGLLLLCGLYDFAGRTAVRGFEKDSKSFSWRRILKEHPNASHYQFPQLRVVSWTQAVAWGTEEETNQFQYLNKKIDINADAKRIWDKEVTKGKHLLAGLEESEMRSITHTHKIWGKYG